MNAKSRSLAVLIDGENTQQLPSLERVLAEAAKYGKIVVCRIYGSWAESETATWLNCLHLHGVEPVQRPIYKNGDDAADIAMIIDAMDILHSGKVNGFCLAASDGHYTGLAIRLRREGMFVAAIGSKPVMAQSLQKECNVFRYVEELPPSADPNSPSLRWKKMFKEAIRMSVSDGKWVQLTTVITTISQEIDSAFDSHDYCHTQPKFLVESCPEEFETAEGENIGEPSGYYVRIKSV